MGGSSPYCWQCAPFCGILLGYATGFNPTIFLLFINTYYYALSLSPSSVLERILRDHGIQLIIIMCTGMGTEQDIIHSAHYKKVDQMSTISDFLVFSETQDTPQLLVHDWLITSLNQLSSLTWPPNCLPVLLESRYFVLSLSPHSGVLLLSDVPRSSYLLRYVIGCEMYLRAGANLEEETTPSIERANPMNGGDRGGILWSQLCYYLHQRNRLEARVYWARSSLYNMSRSWACSQPLAWIKITIKPPTYTMWCATKCKWVRGRTPLQWLVGLSVSVGIRSFILW